MNFTIIDLRTMTFFLVDRISDEILEGVENGYLELVDMFTQKSMQKNGEWEKLHAA